VWEEDGMPVCIAPIGQNFPEITSDNGGGAIIVWEDETNLSDTDICAQRINHRGKILWKKYGVKICSGPQGQSNQRVASDGFDGAIITWNQYSENTAYLYVQRVNGEGVSMWKKNGIVITDGYTSDSSHMPDGTGGAIIVWNDDRNDVNNIFAQKISANGTKLWSPGGIAVSASESGQVAPVLTSDFEGGAIIAWRDFRNTEYPYGDIYAQRITASGQSFLKASLIDKSHGTGTENCDHVIIRNYPNPFNPSTTIEYAVDRDSHIDLSIYTVSGRLVRTLAHGYRQSGAYRAIWDGKNVDGNEAASGIYFYCLQTEFSILTRKMILLR
jgi:hypothetical protein